MWLKKVVEEWKHDVPTKSGESNGKHESLEADIGVKNMEGCRKGISISWFGDGKPGVFGVLFLLVELGRGWWMSFWGRWRSWCEWINVDQERREWRFQTGIWVIQKSYFWSEVLSFSCFSHGFCSKLFLLANEIFGCEVMLCYIP